MSAQQDFLRSEFRTLSFMGASQHVPIYAADASERERAAFRAALYAKLEAFEPAYAQAEIYEDGHVANIVGIADELSIRFAPALHERRFRIGPAQKALNLYLKYLWCAGLSQRPPHCPVDAIVLAEAGNTRIRWSTMDSVEKYREAIDVLRTAATKAGFVSLAEWELEAWRNAKAKTVQVALQGMPSCHAFATPCIP